MAGAGSSSGRHIVWQPVSKFTKIPLGPLQLIAEFLYDPCGIATDLVSLKKTAKRFRYLLDLPSCRFSNAVIDPDSVRRRILARKQEAKAEDIAIEMAPPVNRHQRFFHQVSTALMLDIMHNPQVFQSKPIDEKEMAMSIMKQYAPDVLPYLPCQRHSTSCLKMDFIESNLTFSFALLILMFTLSILNDDFASLLGFGITFLQYMLQRYLDAPEASVSKCFGPDYNHFAALKIALYEEGHLFRPNAYSLAYANVRGRCSRKHRARVLQGLIEAQAEEYQQLIPNPVRNLTDNDILDWLAAHPAMSKKIVPLLMRLKFSYHADVSDPQTVSASMEEGLALVANFHHHVKVDLSQRIAALPHQFRAGQIRRLASGLLFGLTIGFSLVYGFLNPLRSASYRINPFHMVYLKPLFVPVALYFMFSLYAMANHSRYFKRAVALTTLAINFKAAKLSGIRFSRETEETFEAYSSDIPLKETTPFMAIQKCLCPRRRQILPAERQALMAGHREQLERHDLNDLRDRLDMML